MSKITKSARNKPKKRSYKCKAHGCENRFDKYQGDLRQWCSVDCGAKLAKQKLEKKRAKEHRERKKAIRPLNAFHREAKKACHKYIRERDKNLPCVSCLRTEAMEWHAGHYLESGNNPSIRYDESNIHKQCSACNTHKGGNTAEYRIELVRRIGEDAVMELEENRGHGYKFTREELKEITIYYKKKLKELLKDRGETND